MRRDISTTLLERWRVSRYKPAIREAPPSTPSKPSISQSKTIITSTNSILGLLKGKSPPAAATTHNAKATFHEVEQDKTCPVFLKWEAEHSLARLYETENRPALAKQEYRAALATFESARDTVRHEDSQLSFLTNASRIYDDYIHFLVAQKKTSEALRSADYSRARTLAEGLGLLNKKAPSAAPNPQQLSRRAHGAILFYWLGESQSYLWAITPQRTDLFTLPPRAQIEAARAALSQIDRRPAARPRLR